MASRSPPARAVVVALLAAVAVVGVVFRVWVYRHLLGTPNADEAVIGLMARHALHGDLTAFSWGTAYGGPQEAYLTAPLFWLFGSSWVALRLVPIALNALACGLTWLVGRRTIGEPGAVTAAALLWIWPPYTIYQLVHQSGFYASNVVYPLLLMLLALRVTERPVAREVALFGLVLGLAFWETSQIVPVALGIVAWVVWQQPRALRHAPIGIAAAMVGIITWSTLAWWRGLPTSESHGLVAGLTGAGLAAAGPHVLLWDGWRKVLIGLVFSSALGFGGGLVIMTLISRVFFHARPETIRRWFDKLQMLSAAFMAFGHGSNDGQKFIGVFTIFAMWVSLWDNM